MLSQPVIIVWYLLGRCSTGLKQACTMSQFDNCHCGFLVCSLFHCCVLLSLFDYNLFTIIDIDTLLAGLATQANAVQRVPTVE